MTTVLFEVTGVQPCKSGAIIAVASVKIEIGDVELVLQNWMVRRAKGAVIVSGPATRCPVTGQNVAAMALPDELHAAIVNEIVVRAKIAGVVGG